MVRQICPCAINESEQPRSMWDSDVFKHPTKLILRITQIAAISVAIVSNLNFREEDCQFPDLPEKVKDQDI